MEGQIYYGRWFCCQSPRLFKNNRRSWYLLKDEIENRRNLGKALIQFGYDEGSFEEIDFVPGWSDFYIGSGVRLDILTEMVGLENCSFDQALSQATIAEILDVPVPFLHINQLIKNKKAINRPKDMIDVMELEKIIKFQQEQDK